MAAYELGMFNKFVVDHCDKFSQDFSMAVCNVPNEFIVFIEDMDEKTAAFNYMNLVNNKLKRLDLTAHEDTNPVECEAVERLRSVASWLSVLETIDG